MINSLSTSERNEILGQYFARSSVACIIVNTEGAIVECNEGFVRLLRLLKIPVGKNFESFLISSNKNLNWKKAGKMNLIFRASDSLPVLVDCLIFPYSGGWMIFGESITLSEGGISGKMNILINEMADLNREVVRQKKELEELSAVKNRFLGMAAHDLRNPSGYIKEFSSILLELMSENLTEDQLKIIGTIRETSSYMNGIVEDLLDISKIEAGVLDLNLERLDLRTFLTENISFNNIMANKKGIEIIFTAETEALEMLADKYKLAQVMNNLLSNAIKFSNPGSKVTVRMVNDGEKSVKISVEDNGMGIPAGELDKLFKPFQKFSVKATKGEKSTGLGMVIVKNIVEAHGGMITVESEPSKGTAMIFTIPIMKQPKEVSHG